jgi:hypothetical protein
MSRIRGLVVACLLLAANIVFIGRAEASMYAFTTHTFTSCGVTGQNGPTLDQCKSAYSATSWALNVSNFNVLNGIQYWTVPATGSYALDIYGAKGGNNTGTSFTPGQGARIQVTVALTYGQQLRILVGQPGGAFLKTGGGGGGTFVYNHTTSTLIAVAGGGGGAGEDGGNACNASLTESGSTCKSISYSGGTSGNGGGGSGQSGWGSGGGGYSGIGSASGTFAGTSANSFLGGGTGAGSYSYSSCNGAWGGFGSGGGGGCNGGGGGGGYSGGASGGGGGGSYLTGSNQSSSVISGSTAAQVIITTAQPVVTDTTPPVITGPGSATGSTSSISIAESTTAVTTFAANETVTWTKSGTDGSFFAIGSSTGVLTITAQDFETRADANGDNTYIVVITATDSATNATSQTLSVTITNVNEAPLISTNGSAATYAITQAENISAVATFAGTDVDTGTTLTFSISGTDAADFQIGSATGALSFAQSPDFELPVDSDANNTYVVSVVLSDGALSDTQTVTITITNVNENLSAQVPTFSGPANKGAVVTISMTVDAASRVMFFVNGKRIATCKSRVTSGSYPNNVATCAWKPSISGLAVITATVTPVAANFSATTSPPVSVIVGRRTGVR